jgi:hypothetical protein
MEDEGRFSMETTLEVRRFSLPRRIRESVVFNGGGVQDADRFGEFARPAERNKAPVQPVAACSTS